MLHLNATANHGRFVPAFTSGRHDGFRLVQMVRGGIFERLGFKIGDKLTQIDDIDVTKPDDVMRAQGRWVTAKMATVTLWRRDQKVILTYTFGPERTPSEALPVGKPH